MNIKRSVRLTRRSYRRKLIMFGASIFASLALVATGFAAWVLSNDAKKEESGEVVIAAVHEESVDISDIQFIKDDPNNEAEKADSFIFEPLESDTLGRVRYDGSSDPENLDVKFQWSIDNYQIVGNVYVDFKIPATVYSAIEAGWIDIDVKDANETSGFELRSDETIKNEQNADVSYKVLRYYIQNQQGAITAADQSEDGVVSYTVEKDGDTVSKVTFTMNIAFTWGDEFDGLNPGIYYDTPYEDGVSGANVEYEDVKKTLNELKATLHGLTYDEYMELEESEIEDLKVENYIIVINAEVA